MKLQIYSDGGARGNPGPAAAGAVIKNSESGEIILKCSEYLGKTTNNQAEYRALILGLQKAKRIFKMNRTNRTDGTNKKEVKCFLDSELVVKHLNHEYKIKDAGLQPIFIQAWNLTLDFDSVTFTHIPREENKEADKLVNEELDRHRTLI